MRKSVQKFELGDIVMAEIPGRRRSEKRIFLVFAENNNGELHVLDVFCKKPKIFSSIKINRKDLIEGSLPHEYFVIVDKITSLEGKTIIKKVDRIDKNKIDELLRRMISILVKKYYNYFHKPKSKFIPEQSYIRYAGRVYNAEEIEILINSSLDFWLTAGKFAKQFEEKFAKFLGVKYCILVNSGSSANLLAISALTSPKLGKRRLKPGDEVITTACAFPTTVNPIIQNNLTPVFIDVDIGTYNIQAKKIEAALSEKTKAIFLAHTLGNPFDLDKVMSIAQKYNLWLIEDNCDALGSKYKDKYTGTFGHIATFSFYPAHHITMGEGGALVTNDLQLKRIIESFRDWGRDCWCEPGHDNTCKRRFSQKFGRLPFGYDHKYVYSHIGYNLKITDMQAAVGLAQLKKLPRFIKIRKKNFSILYNRLKEIEKYFVLPQSIKGADPSWFGFPLLVRKEAPFNRRDIVTYLERNKIATRMLFGGNLIKQPAYENVKCRVYGSLKNTDWVMNNLFWIGVYPGLKKEMIEYVIDKIKVFCREKLWNL